MEGNELIWWLIPVVLALALAGLAALRLWDLAADAAAISELRRRSKGERGRFDPVMVKALPEPARRYFLFAITPGTRLYRGAAIEMSGELGLGSKQAPKYRPITARQILAPPYGLVWKVRRRLYLTEQLINAPFTQAPTRCLGTSP